MRVMSPWDPVLLKNNGNHPETQRNKPVTPVDPDSSFQKCCPVDVLISRLALGNIKMALHMGVAVVWRSFLCSLNLVKDCYLSKKTKEVMQF